MHLERFGSSIFGPYDEYRGMCYKIWVCKVGFLGLNLIKSKSNIWGRLGSCQEVFVDEAISKAQRDSHLFPTCFS